MTSPIETNNVVEMVSDLRDPWLEIDYHYRERISEALIELNNRASESQSLSDRIDVQSALLGRARWLMRPYCGADEALRIFCDDVTASLTQGGNTNG